MRARSGRRQPVACASCEVAFAGRATVIGGQRFCCRPCSEGRACTCTLDPAAGRKIPVRHCLDIVDPAPAGLGSGTLGHAA